MAAAVALVPHDPRIARAPIGNTRALYEDRHQREPFSAPPRFRRKFVDPRHAPLLQASGVFVQGNSNFFDGGSQSSLAVTLGSNCGAGNLICGIVKYGTATSVFSSITSNQSGTVVVADTDTTVPGSNTGKSFYIYNIGAGSTTITLNFTGANGVYPRIEVLEFSGLDTSSSVLNAHEFLNQEPVLYATDIVTSDNGASTSTNVDGCTIVGFTVFTNYDAGSLMAAGTGFTLRTDGSTAPNNFDHIYSESRTQATQGVVQATFSPSSGVGVGNFVTFMMAFQVPQAATQKQRRTLGQRIGSRQAA